MITVAGTGAAPIPALAQRSSSPGTADALRQDA
jgi:hypothetical protein